MSVNPQINGLAEVNCQSVAGRLRMLNYLDTSLSVFSELCAASLEFIRNCFGLETVFIAALHDTSCCTIEAVSEQGTLARGDRLILARQPWGQDLSCCETVINQRESLPALRMPDSLGAKVVSGPYIGAPIRRADGSLYGLVLACGPKQPKGTFSPMDRETILLVAELLARRSIACTSPEPVCSRDGFRSDGQAQGAAYDWGLPHKAMVSAERFDAALAPRISANPMESNPFAPALTTARIPA